jgi:hypothetical protein
MSQLRPGLPSLIDCKLNSRSAAVHRSDVFHYSSRPACHNVDHCIIDRLGLCAAAALHYINVAIPRYTEGHDLTVWRVG